MPELFQRKLIQILPERANEPTRTLSSVSNKGNYISLRPLIKATTEEEENFPFECCFAGFTKSCEVSKVDEATNKQSYKFDIHTNRLLDLPIQDTWADTYWKTWPSGDIEETGTLYPFGPDTKGVDFVELWQPINAETYTSKDNFLVGATEPNARSVTLKLDSDDYYGITVIIGDVVQGVLHKKKDKKDIAVLRCVVDKETLRFKKYEIKFGSSLLKFPSELPASLVVGSFINGWEIVEA